MAGSLVLIDSETVSSGVSSVSLTGIDSTYNVYQVIINSLTADTNSSGIEIRVTKSGSADTTSNYDYASLQLKAISAFADNSATNGDSWDAFNTTGTATGSAFNLTAYLFNFANASEYSFVTFEEATTDNSVDLRGATGGGVHTVASASDGVSIHLSTGGNIDGGEFKLYGLRK